MPYYWSQIETLENLQYVAGLVDGFDQNRFLAAIMGKPLGKGKIVHMRNELNEITDKLEEEYLVLEEFGKTFNEKFATRNNQYFSSAMTLLRKMHSGTSKMVEIYRQFAPQNKAARRAAHAENQTMDLFSHSTMGGQDYTLPMFNDMDAYTPEVGELFDAMKRFMEHLSKSLKLCKGILEEEEQIRHDPDACLERYHFFKDEHRGMIKALLEAISLDSSIFLAENNPAIKMRKESKDEKQFAERGFHNLTESATVVLASKEMIEEAKRGEFTAPEIWLFDAHERSHIRRVREIIRKFDTYLPEDYTRKTLPAKYIACLLRWCKPREDKAFVKYFKETYEETGGKLTVPKNPAVNQQKNELTKSDADYVSLVEKWEKIA